MTGACCIALDFDGTLILEHVLISWVLFLLRHSGWPAARRLLFMAESFTRGAAAMMLSRWPACAAWAVRTAFGTFSGVDEKTLAALVHCRTNRGALKKAHVLSLNPATVGILKCLVESCRVHPEIRVYSQGSSREAIRQFLGRSDVRKRLSDIGVSAASVGIHANDMETDDGGRCTGAIQGNILTKFNRLHMMPEHAIFIGDDKDESVLNRMDGGGSIRFVNWRQWKGPESIRAGV